MKYSFIFDTVAQYQAAKASGGAILNVLQTDTSKTYGNIDGALSRTAISTIKETGQTLIDCVNIIVSRKEGGEIGDTLLYKGGEYFWLKGQEFMGRTAYTSPPAHPAWKDMLGSNNATKNELAAAGYIIIGFVGHKEGNRVRIFADVQNNNGLDTAPIFNSISNSSPLPFIEESYNNEMYLRKLTSTPSSLRQEKIGILCPFSFEIAKAMNGEFKIDRISWPVFRSIWNIVVDKIIKGETMGEGGSVTGGGAYFYDNGLQKWRINYEIRYENNFSYVCPSDWNFDFDYWYRTILVPIYPCGAESYFGADVGRKNTYLMAQQGEESFPAPYACYTYKPSGTNVPAEFGEGKWWMVSAMEMFLMAKNWNTLRNKGIRLNKDEYHVSTLSGSRVTRCFYFNKGGLSGRYYTYPLYTFPVTEFNI